MKVVQVNKDELNNFADKQKHSQFLQSWEWGEFQKVAGNKIIRLGFEENGNLIWAVTLIKNNLPLGINYFYAPRIGHKYLKDEQLKNIFIEIKKVAKVEKIIFLRFDPNFKFQISNFKFQISRTIAVQPSKTLILDLTKSEEELLKDMHHKTRYNIRLAEKKGVKIIEAEPGRFEEFWQLMEQTRDRDQFRLHSKAYYRKMLDIEFVNLLLAEYQRKVIAGIIVSFFGNMAVYIHGASGSEFRNAMSPYALQWQAIKKAKEKGFKYYDLNGIDESKWPGVTRFKRGFGGEEINYPGTFDMIFSRHWYSVYKVFRKIRRSM